MYLMLMLPSLLLATLFISCQSPSEKIESATEDVAAAKENLQDVKQEVAADARKTASIEEWKMFKSEKELIIRNNEMRIKEMRAKMNSSTSATDKAHALRIEALEKRNKELNTRIANYEASQSDWESFKREVKNDLDAIAEGFRELMENNKG
jgi:exonuclease VII large subunit